MSSISMDEEESMDVDFQFEEDIEILIPGTNLIIGGNDLSTLSSISVSGGDETMRSASRLATMINHNAIGINASSSSINPSSPQSSQGSVWEGMTGSLASLRQDFLELKISKEIDEMSPLGFAQVFLTPQVKETRLRCLEACLKAVINNESWWNSTSSFKGRDVGEGVMSITKLSWVCRYWGIEHDPDFIAGEVTLTQNLLFWKKVLDIVKRLSKMPDKAKNMLTSEFPENEEFLTWDEVVNQALQKTEDQSHCVTLRHIKAMEVIMTNDVLNIDMWKKMIDDVAFSLDDLKDNKERDEKTAMRAARTFNRTDDESTIKAALEIGGKFCDYVQNFVDFLHLNSCFEGRKTEFMVFHSECTEKVLKLAMQMHQSFLKKMAEIDIPDFEDDDLFF